MQSHARRVARALVLTLLTVATGCGGAFEVVAQRSLAADISAPRGIVLLPLAMMTHQADALEVAVRSSETAAWLLDHTDVPIVGPLDYRTFKPLDEIRVASTDTDLATHESGHRIDLNGWWSISVLVIENRSRSVHNVVDTRKGGSGKTVKQVFGVESELQVEVQILDAMRGNAIARARTKAKEPEDGPIILKGDRRPLIRKLIEETIALAFGEAAERLGQPGQRLVRSDDGLPSVPALAASSFHERPSFEAPLADKDPIVRETKILTIWYRVSPTIKLGPALTATKHPGVLLTSTRAPLQANDVVTTVAGKPVRDLYQLDRALRGCGGVPCAVGVVRNGAPTELQVQLQPKAAPEAAD